MMDRRQVLAALVGVVGAAAGAALPRAAAAADLAGSAAAFIERRGNEVVAVVNGSEPLETRRSKVVAILRETVDIQGVARFVLGRHWRTASEAQRAEYLRLFEETLVRNLSARFGELRGVAFSIGRSVMASEEEAVVTTQVTRPNNPAVTLDWRVASVNGAPRVIDLVAEGTSLRITQRSEYGAVVQRGGGMDGLLDAMRRQLAQLEAQERQGS
jgi:phospholipid transport system substrate-binding protein